MIDDRPSELPPGIRRPHRKISGFTLIEIMIVVAIVGILSAIAYPAYGKYVRETRRVDGHFALLSAAQAMERCRSTRFSYSACTVPDSSSEGFYTVSLTTQSASAFTITATAVGVQAHDTDCATITLDHLGTQGPVTTAGESSECWD